MKTLAAINQKGGQAKTTTVFHIGEAAVKAGLRVLYVDNDRQGSLSLLLPSTGSEPGMVSSDLYSKDAVNVIPEQLDSHRSIIRCDKTHDYTVADTMTKLPAMHLRRLAKNFDICLIDTPGSLEGASESRVKASLIAADAVICPVSVGLLEMAGLADLWKFIGNVKKIDNTKLRMMGILPSKVNSKSPEEAQGLQTLRDQFGKVIFPHILHERASVKQSIAKRKPVWVGTRGAGHAKAAAEWKAACHDILINLGVVRNDN